MNSIFSACLVAAGFFLATAALAGDIYQWTDQDGQVHFGQDHPAGTEATEVNLVYDAPTLLERQAA